MRINGRYGRASQVEPMIVHVQHTDGRYVRMGDWFAELVVEDRAKAGRPVERPEVWHLDGPPSFCASQVARWQINALEV